MSAIIVESKSRIDVRELLAHLPHTGSFVGAEWFEHPKTYPMYEKAARLVKPKAVLELGVLLGFGLVAFARGYPEVEKLVGFDNEQDIDGSLELAASNVKMATGLELVRCKTLERVKLHGEFDLVHVDADHSAIGTAEQAAFGWGVLSPNGVMLVDDYLADKRVKAGVEAFAEDVGLEFKVWRSHRGWAVFARDLRVLPDEL